MFSQPTSVSSPGYFKTSLSRMLAIWNINVYLLHIWYEMFSSFLLILKKNCFKISFQRWTIILCSYSDKVNAKIWWKLNVKEKVISYKQSIGIQMRASKHNLMKIRREKKGPVWSRAYTDSFNIRYFSHVPNFNVNQDLGINI